MNKTDGHENVVVRTESDLRASGLTAVEGTTADGRKTRTYSLTQPVPEPRPVIVRAPGFYWVRTKRWFYNGANGPDTLETRIEVWQWQQPEEDARDQDGWYLCGDDVSWGEPDEVLAGPLTPPVSKAKP